MNDVALPTLTLDEIATEIRGLGKRIIRDVIEIGERLTQAKALCVHGEWLPWLDREFAWSSKTAERFMSVAALGRQNRQIVEYDIPLSGLYLLAANSTPGSVRDAVFAKAAHGERITVDGINQAIAAVGVANTVKSMERLAARIDREEAEHEAARLDLALEIQELRNRIEAGEVGDQAAIDWWGWYDDNFRLPQRDVADLLAFADEHNPAGASRFQRSQK